MTKIFIALALSLAVAAHAETPPKGAFISGTADGDIQLHMRAHLKFQGVSTVPIDFGAVPYEEMHLSYHMPYQMGVRATGKYRSNIDGEVSGTIHGSLIVRTGTVWSEKITLIETNGTQHEMTMMLYETGTCPPFDNHPCKTYKVTSAVIQ